MSELRLPGCTVVDHPLVKTKVTILRSKDTPTELFRRTLHELTALLAFEATRDLAVGEIDIETPLERCKGHRLSKELTIVPILRAGLGMAEAMLDVLPQARLGHVGIYRNERTFAPMSYYFKAPRDLEDSDVFLVDPMLATGNSAADAAAKLKTGGARRLRLIALLGSVTGAKLFHSQHPEVPMFLAALDEKLNDRAYIVPGLGDAGDRYCET
ncbi:MAG TPA: uracil phosphoribosyltransferase [Terrimicrobiaceae bacterium]